MNEKEFEDILAKYPDFLEEGLKLVGRQITIFGRRIYLLFEDRFGNKLLVELKLGPIKDIHIGQILSYEGTLLSEDEPVMRVMLVGNRVPPNIRKILDHHGIALAINPCRESAEEPAVLPGSQTIYTRKLTVPISENITRHGDLRWVLKTGHYDILMKGDELF